MTWWAITLIGAGVGFFAGLFGAGGSAVGTPLLHLVGVPAFVALASPLPTAVPVALASSRAYWRRGFVERRILVWSVAVGFPATVVGALVTPYVGGRVLVRVIEVVVAAIGVRLALASFGVTADELGAMLYDSVQRKLMGLPDEVRVFPAHGAGSACGKNLSTERQSTIGEQRRTNYACAPMTEEQFLALVTGGQPSAPGYFAFDAVLNRKARELFDHTKAPRPLDAAEFAQARADGAVVVDARDPQEFATGHLAGAVNIPADGRFAETAGSVIAPDRKVLVVAPQDREEEIVVRLARIGFDHVVGYLREPEGAFLEMAADMARASRLTATELHDALDRPEAPVVLDVRNAGEREQGAVQGSLHIPLAELTRRLDEVPADRPVVVHCAGGYRSSVAASLLRNAGRADVSDLLGGYGAWQTMHAAV